MQQLRVLIAEEKDFVAARLAAQLEGFGHCVLGVVKDGQVAVASAAQLQPELVLLDQHLPPSDGIETARTIFATHHIPSVLVTGYVGADLVRRGQQAGVLAYLVWPADARSLASALRVALTRFREFMILLEQIGDVQQALRTQLVVERAKRMLMRQLGLTGVEAFRYLHRHSRMAGVPVGESAEDLFVAGQLLFGNPDPVSCLATILRTLGWGEAAGFPTGRLVRSV